MKEESNQIQKKVQKKEKVRLLKDDQEKIQEVPKKISKKKEKDQMMTIYQQIAGFIDSQLIQMIMTIITLYALFGDDVRVLVTDKQGDQVFWILNIVALICFSVEIILASISKDDYFNGFFFWLDFASTLSLLLDIGWVTEAIFSGDSGSSAAQSTAQLARAGRASRVGTKSGRIVRLIRLIRLVKLYKQAQQNLIKEAEKIEDKIEDQEYKSSVKKTGTEAVFFPDSQKKKSIRKVNKQKLDRIPEEGQQHVKHSQSSLNPPKPSVSSLGKKVGRVGNAYRPDAQYFDQKPLPVVPDQIQPHSFTHVQELDQPSKSKFANLPGGLPPIKQNPDKKQSSGEFFEKNNKILNQAKSILEINKQNTKKEEKQEEEEEEMILKETKVGAKLSDLTTRRVIMLVMSIMFSIPIFSIETYFDNTVSYDIGLAYTHMFQNSSADIMKESFLTYLLFHKDQRNEVVFVDFFNSDKNCCKNYPNELFKFTTTDYNKLRDDEQSIYTFTNTIGEGMAMAVSDISDDYQFNAILSIVRTIFVSVILGTGAMVFSKDVEDLIIAPLEKMLEKVQRIAENPLNACQIEEQEALIMEEMEKKGLTKELKDRLEDEKMETAVLEKLIIKTGALLALVFGEAGSEIIHENMNSGGGEINPMIAGKKMMGMFGFIEIRNFSDATEVLQTGVMLFVNEIAEITHATIDQSLGQCNKNIGEVFLVVWKYHENFINRKIDGNVELKVDQVVRELSNLPIFACIRTIIGMRFSKKMKRYGKIPEFKARFPHSVKMGFGLHNGWAIEGAIGSNYKIDASYLSPNVNISSRLTAASKQFGVYIVISGPFYKNLTLKCQKYLRHIDTVTVKGSLVPLEFYTVDLMVDKLDHIQKQKDKFDNANFSAQQKKKKRVIERLKKNKLKQDILDGKRNTADLFETDKTIISMMQDFTPEFFNTWKLGFKSYIGGDWQKASEIFSQTLNMLPDQQDNPSNTLLQVIKDNNGKPPSYWDGYRILTDK